RTRRPQNRRRYPPAQRPRRDVRASAEHWLRSAPRSPRPAASSSAAAGPRRSCSKRRRRSEPYLLSELHLGGELQELGAHAAAGGDDGVDDAVLVGLFGCHVVVARESPLDFLEWLPRVGLDA